MLIVDAARRIAGHAALERQLFEVVGQWSIDEPDADSARVFAVLSRHHGWRSLLWAQLQPVLHDVPAAGRFVELAPSAPDRLSSLDAALGRLLERYREHQAGCTEVADGPTSRVLRIVIADTEADLAELRSLGRR